MTKLMFCSPTAVIVLFLAVSFFLVPYGSVLSQEKESDGVKQASVLIFMRAVQPTIEDRKDFEFNADEFELYKRTQPVMVRRTGVIAAALREVSAEILKSHSDPIAYVRARVEVDFPGNGQVMRIRMIGDHQEMVDMRNIVAAVADTYLSMSGEGENSLDRRMIELLELERHAIMRRVAHLESQFEDARAKSDANATSSGEYPNHFREMELERDARVLKNISDRLTDLKVNLDAPGRLKLLQRATIEEVH